MKVPAASVSLTTAVVVVAPEPPTTMKVTTCKKILTVLTGGD